MGGEPQKQGVDYQIAYAETENLKRKCQKKEYRTQKRLKERENKRGSRQSGERIRMYIVKNKGGSPQSDKVDTNSVKYILKPEHHC